MATEHVGHGWDSPATWDAQDRVVVTPCAECGREVRLGAPTKPTPLALWIAARFRCDGCEED